MKNLFTLLILLCFGISAQAQIRFSDSLQVSLLTVDPGPEAYECFGHTGIRAKDLRHKQDIVFHYGVYNYNEPHFIWHFVLGECNYRMGGNYASDFFDEYKQRELNVTEQVLQLDSAHTSELVHALAVNFLPRNRNYRYNYFFDNCATRPFHMLNRWAEIKYDTAWVQPITLRDMLQEMTGRGNWLDFGISLVVAGRADQRAWFTEQMFLPKYLCKALSNAHTDGHTLISNEVIHNNKPESAISAPTSSTMTSPLAVGLIMMIIGLILTTLRYTSNKGQNVIQKALQIYDTTWLTVTALAGCIVWMLNFFSLHPAVDHNLNCWWLLPTNLIIIAFIWIKKAEKVRLIYFFIIFAAEIIYILLISCNDQYYHPAFTPWLVLIAVRSVAHIIDRRKK
ncbi:MAG: DUF4105 domain-containing protein [Bacteroidales bacterium]|nr:DUF4105 domain-containing protein [Bacteroidales bacterium]